MKAVYLLPCSCGSKVPVHAGQAGAKVSCTCGQELAVPTLRALKALEQAAPSAPLAAAAAKDSGWSTSRGMMFSLGLLASLIATALVCFHLFMYVQLWDGGDHWKQDHLEGVQREVDAMSPADTLVDFEKMASKGLGFDGVPPWSRITSVRDSSFRWLMASLFALAWGVVSLVASLVGMRPIRAKTK